VIRNEHHTLVHVDELEPAGVAREDGWRKMDIRFFGGAVNGSKNACFFRTIFPPGAAHERHYHPNADEFIYVISGRAALGTEDEEHEVTAGGMDFVPAGKVHWARNLDQNEPVELVGIYVGGGSLEEAGYEYVGEITEEYRKAGA
jgi:quercetin dioxygenase-like cupin family protein